jgi:non-ribosomal peptide synthetase component F
MTLLAAFGTLLYRMTGQDDILLGSPIANRSRVEIESLIGFFSNTVVLRVRLDGNPTFRELIGRVREMALGAYAHQDMPFERIVEAARPSRDAGLNPLFQVNFRVQSGLPAKLDLPDVEVEPFRIDLGFSRFDLAVELHLREDGIGGYVEYNTDLFKPEFAARLAEDFEALLHDVLASPDSRLVELQLRSERRGGQGARLPIGAARGRAQKRAQKESTVQGE